jgi:hypothetical protein
MNWPQTPLTLSLISGAVLLTACAGAEERIKVMSRKKQL